MDDPDRSCRHFGRNLLSRRRADGEPLALVPHRRTLHIAPHRRMPRRMVKIWLRAAPRSVLAPARGRARAQGNVHVTRHPTPPAAQADPDLLPEARRAAEALVAWFRGAPP